MCVRECCRAMADRLSGAPFLDQSQRQPLAGRHLSSLTAKTNNGLEYLEQGLCWKSLEFRRELMSRLRSIQRVM